MSRHSQRDRALGAMVGLAIGDALGATNEFCQRDTAPHLTGIVGGGAFNLKPGEWTDDTSMALALAESLLHHDALDEHDLMDRFCDWRFHGAYSCHDRCIDVGRTIDAALHAYLDTGDPIAGDPDPQSAGNGSLMRLAPVPVRFWRHPARMRDVARRQSLTTHGASVATDACVAFSELVAEAIAGATKSEVLSPRRGTWGAEISRVMSMAMLSKERSAIASTGYVVDSMEASLWCINQAENFSEAVLTAANLCDDADTVAAITGQLAGAIWGLSSLPSDWRKHLAWHDRIVTTADHLFAASMAATAQ